jgi:hypothetical protein
MAAGCDREGPVGARELAGVLNLKAGVAKPLLRLGAVRRDHGDVSEDGAVCPAVRIRWIYQGGDRLGYADSVICSPVRGLVAELPLGTIRRDSSLAPFLAANYV